MKGRKRSNFASLFVAFVAIIGGIYAADMTLAKFKFVGYRNVWHEEVHLHQKLDIGDIATDTEETIIELCANRCVIAENECEAFYIEEDSSTGTECNLVNEDLGDKNRTIGYGEDTLKIYYVKTQVYHETVTRPSELEPPCDQDDTTLSAADCATMMDGLGVIEYYECDNIQNTYLGTVGLVSDVRCPGEDRIKECELVNGAATSNILEVSRIQNAFLKAYEAQDPMRTGPGDMLEWMEMTFRGGPQNIQRIIVRSATDGTVDKLKAGKFTFYKGATEANIPFEFANANICAMMINIDAADQAIKDVAGEADKIRLDSITTHSPVLGKVGFKIDLFILETGITPPSSGNNTQTP